MQTKLVDLLVNQIKYPSYRDQFNEYLLHNKVDHDFMRKYVDLIPWDSVSFIFDNINEEFLREFRDYINWNMLGLFSVPDFSYDFIRQFEDKLRLEEIIESQRKRNRGMDLKLEKEFLNNN